jgi:RNA polymerase sigma factor (sigma-70 family)
MSYTKSTSQQATDRDIKENLAQHGIYRRRGEEQLFTTYMYFIKEGMKKYPLTEDEAFDAYSDAVLACIEKVTNGSFEGLSTIKTFLFQIFSNKCVDLVRRKTTNKQSVHRTLEISDMLLHLSDTAKTVVHKLIEQTDNNLLQQKLDELGSNCRQLLLLSAEGNSDKQIAEQMEYKTADVVKTSRLRCLERLRRLYKPI